MIDDAELDGALAALAAHGSPAVRGEVVEGEVAGYHFYPSRDQVLPWLDEAGWQLVDQGFSSEDGWGYRHLLVRRV